MKDKVGIIFFVKTVFGDENNSHEREREREIGRWWRRFFYSECERFM